MRFEGDEGLIRYMRERRCLLNGRPTCLSHDDYRLANFVLGPGKELYIIDFQGFRRVEPYHAMRGLLFSARHSPHFATGQVRGFFGGEAPLDFWELLSLYIAALAGDALPSETPYGQRGSLEFGG
jgi:serine/threonine-protein kinase